MTGFNVDMFHLFIIPYLVQYSPIVGCNVYCFLYMKYMYKHSISHRICVSLLHKQRNNGFRFPSLLPKSSSSKITLIVYIRYFISTLFLCLGLPDFLQPGIDTPVTHHHDSSISASSFPTHCRVPVSHLLISEFLPVVKFSDLVHPPDSCAVCLYDFERRYEIDIIWHWCSMVLYDICLNMNISIGVILTLI